MEIGIFLIILGLGCVVGGYASAYLSDVFEMKNVGRSAIMLVLVTSFITILLEPFLNKALAFVLAFFWGLSRQSMEGWLYVACSRNYNGRLESYANMKQLHSLSFCLYMGVLVVTKLQVEIKYILLFFILLSPMCFYYLNRLPDPIVKIKKK